MLFDLYITSVKQDIQHFSRDALTHKLTLDAQRTNGTIRARQANYRDSKKSRCRKKIQILKLKKHFIHVYIFFIYTFIQFIFSRVRRYFQQVLVSKLTIMLLF